MRDLLGHFAPMGKAGKITLIIFAGTRSIRNRAAAMGLRDQVPDLIDDALEFGAAFHLQAARARQVDIKRAHQPAGPRREHRDAVGAGQFVRIVTFESAEAHQRDDAARAAIRARPLLAAQLWLAGAAASCGRAVGSLSTGSELALVGLLTIAIAVPLVAGVVRYRPR